MKASTRWWAKPVVSWGVGITIGVLSLYLALRNISWTEVRQAFQQANWGYIGLALISVIVGVYAKVIRWQVLLGDSARRVKFSRLAMAHLAGQSLNMIYPARAGDISRVYLIGSLGISRTFLLGTVILEKLWDLLSYSLVFVLMLLLLPLPDWVGESAYSLVIVTLILFFASFVISYKRAWFLRLAEYFLKWLPQKLQKPLLERLHMGLTSLDVLQDQKDLFWLAFWSSIVWLTAILNNHLVLLALNIRLPITASVLILVALQAGISLPTTPGRLGIFQYICVLTLGIYGIDQALGFSYSILLHGVALLTILFSGLVCLWILGLMDIKRAPRRDPPG